MKGKAKVKAPEVAKRGVAEGGARTQDARPKTQDWRQWCEAGAWRGGTGSAVRQIYAKRIRAEGEGYAPVVRGAGVAGKITLSMPFREN